MNCLSCCANCHLRGRSVQTTHGSYCRKPLKGNNIAKLTSKLAHKIKHIIVIIVRRYDAAGSIVALTLCPNDLGYYTCSYNTCIQVFTAATNLLFCNLVLKMLSETQWWVFLTVPCFVLLITTMAMKYVVAVVSGANQFITLRTAQLFAQLCSLYAAYGIVCTC